MFQRVAEDGGVERVGIRQEAFLAVLEVGSEEGLAVWHSLKVRGAVPVESTWQR
jgi:hypothetical protein